MTLRIKDKLRLGLLFLFGLVLLLAALGIGFVYQLQQDSAAILKDNYRSLVYVRDMQQVVDALSDRRRVDTEPFSENLRLEEANITEVSEGHAVRQLRREWEAFRRDSSMPRLVAMQAGLYRIQDLNMQAIVRKNDTAARSAKTATLVIGLFGTFCVLIAFSFVLNFPSYIASPLRQLTSSLQAVANRNYNARMRINSKDEFGELATAFNGMVYKLDEYENSNLAQILFEKRRIETIIANLRDAVIGLDAKKMVLFANPVALNLLNLKEGELVGRYAPDVALKNDLLRRLLSPPRDERELKIYADDRESFFVREAFDVEAEEETTLRIPDGQEEGIQRLTPPKKTRIGQVILLKNITEYHDLDAAKTNFIATVSHELKTPISGLKMSLKLLDDARVGSLNAEQRELLTHASDDAERLLTITGELLNLTQVESGQIQLQIHDVAPSEIVGVATDSLRIQAEQKRVRFTLDVPDTLPAVKADPDKASWVLVNFLSNALRHSPDDASIDIRAKAAKNFVEFTVRDHGPGVRPEHQARVFDRYFRAPGEQGQPSGTGLGLAISKEFIQALGGEIGLDASISPGAAFYFRLPVV